VLFGGNGDEINILHVGTRGGHILMMKMIGGGKREKEEEEEEEEG